MPTSVYTRRRAVVALASVFTLVGASCSASDSGVPPSPPPSPPPPPPPPGVMATVTVDTLTRFQVMSGWEAVAQANHLDPNYLQWRDQLFDLAVGDLGLNRLRVGVRNGAENPVDNFAELLAGRLSDQEWRCIRYTTVNDNTDPNVIAPGRFWFSELDDIVDKVVLPMKARLEARGEQLIFNLNYVAFLNQCNPIPPYPHANAQEYAEFILAAFQHLQQRYGFVPDKVEVILEPNNTGSGSPWTGTAVGQAIVATGQRLAAAGFHPKFIAPSTTGLDAAKAYFDALIQVPGVSTYLDEIAYHRYDGVSDGNLHELADRARTRGLKTAMLEHIGSGVEDLYKDLTLGRVSAWQQFTLAFPPTDNGAHYYVINANNQPVIGNLTRYLRQYFRYVRLGAQRVGATSDNAEVRPVAFVNANGRAAVVIHSAQAGDVFVRGLRPGTYGTSVTTASVTGSELGEQVVGTSGTITVAASAASVLTVYRK